MRTATEIQIPLNLENSRQPWCDFLITRCAIVVLVDWVPEPDVQQAKTIIRQNARVTNLREESPRSSAVIAGGSLGR
ncbi:MAG: hypothetical protein ACYC0X_23365 [Pirellulaceae bacterium]